MFRRGKGSSTASSAILVTPCMILAMAEMDGQMYGEVGIILPAVWICRARTAMADVLSSPPRPQRLPGTPLRTQLPMSPPPSRTPLQRAGADAAITPRRGVPPPSGPTAASPGGTRAPNMRRVAAGVVPAISPAHSEDARQLMFLSTHPCVSFEVCSANFFFENAVD